MRSTGSRFQVRRSADIRSRLGHHRMSYWGLHGAHFPFTVGLSRQTETKVEAASYTVCVLSSGWTIRCDVPPDGDGRGRRVAPLSKDRAPECRGTWTWPQGAQPMLDLGAQARGGHSFSGRRACPRPTPLTTRGAFPSPARTSPLPGRCWAASVFCRTFPNERNALLCRLGLSVGETWNLPCKLSFRK